MMVIRDREAGNIICEVDTLQEGQELIDEYEAEDKAEGTYTPDFYEVVELDKEV